MGVTRQESIRAPHFLFNLTFSGGYKSPVSHLPILAFYQSVCSMGSLAWSNEPGPLERFRTADVFGKLWCPAFGLMNPKESWSRSWKQSLVVGTHKSLWYFVSFAHKNQIRD